MEKLHTILRLRAPKHLMKTDILCKSIRYADFRNNKHRHGTLSQFQIVCVCQALDGRQ